MSNLNKGVKITADVMYSRKGDLVLTLDVYQPPQPNGAGVIFINSGGWASWFPQFFEPTSGRNRLLSDDELEELNPIFRGFSFRPLLAEGFTVFAVRHESTPTSQMPEIVMDLRRAVRFIRFHADDYGVNAERLGLWGTSSGGHLTLLIAATADVEVPNAVDTFEKCSGHVAALVAHYPPSDLQRFKETSTLDDLHLLPALSLTEEQSRGFSPLYLASAKTPPTLIVHGEQDTYVPIVEGESMIRALKELGVPSKFVMIEGAGHVFYGDDIDLAMGETVNWFQEYLG